MRLYDAGPAEMVFTGEAYSEHVRYKMREIRLNRRRITNYNGKEKRNRNRYRNRNRKIIAAVACAVVLVTGVGTFCYYKYTDGSGNR